MRFIATPPQFQEFSFTLVTHQANLTIALATPVKFRNLNFLGLHPKVGILGTPQTIKFIYM